MSHAISPPAAHEAAAGASVIKPGYDPRLTNADLAPLAEKTWTRYNYFAFWMTDVHSVAGYTTAGSLFALGLTGWQVFLAIIIGVLFITFLCNLVARPSQQAGIPYPVASRIAYGVVGANIAALVRGLIAVAWYGIQTYLASKAMVVLLEKVFGDSVTKYDGDDYMFLGLSLLGWICFLAMWAAQALVFWHGMDMIRRFIDFAGPAVYVVMFVLAGYLLLKAGLDDITFNLPAPDHPVGFWATLSAVCGAVAMVVSYFSGPMLNFGDFSRYGKSFDTVRSGNRIGLPINFVAFAVLVVATVSAGTTVFGSGPDGEMITDPVDLIAQIDSTTAVVLGVLTVLIATVGINIVANFVSPAFDFSHVAPQHISWRTGGMIAAVAAVLITPWNLFNNPDAIHYTLDTLAAITGPLFAVLIADFYLIQRKQIVVDDLYTMDPAGRYHYYRGWNLAAVGATFVGGAVGVAIVLWNNKDVAQYNWFITAGVAFVVYVAATWPKIRAAATAGAAIEPAEPGDLFAR